MIDHGNKIWFTEDQLEVLKRRYEDGETTGKLSEVYGISPCTVRRRLKEMGVTIRPAGKTVLVTAQVMGTAIEMRKRGVSWPSISRKTKVNARSIQRRIQKDLGPSAWM